MGAEREPKVWREVEQKVGTGEYWAPVRYFMLLLITTEQRYITGPSYHLLHFSLLTQESALKRIMVELPAILSQYARPVDTSLFPTWRDFLQQFFSQGAQQTPAESAQSA